MFLIKLDWESIRLCGHFYNNKKKGFWVENKNVAEFTEFCFLSPFL